MEAGKKFIFSKVLKQRNPADFFRGSKFGGALRSRGLIT